jgi:exopolyphosphatase/guanosine-5'-triphosphate,3'-diphosphate pyrophosphatase
MTVSQTTTEERVVAFIDMGTNSIRLLVVQIHPHHSFTILTRLKEMIRLGEGEFTEQYLQPAAIDRAVLVAREFVGLARSYGAEEIVAVATAATREAANQRAFLRQLWQEAEVEVHVVSGLEEARLIYLGVVSGVHLGDKQALFIDIGGGSTEVIIGTQQQYRYLNSLKLGAIRLTTRFLADLQGPVPARFYEQVRRHVRHYVMHTLREIKVYPIDLAMGSSGTIESLGDIAARLFLKRPLQRDDMLPYAQLKEVITLLGSLSLEARRKVPGLNPSRADIIMGGAAILDTLMEELALPEIRVTDRGLRDGLLVDYLLKNGHAPAWGEMSPREMSVLQLGRTCRFNEAHARTTARLALALFDSGREAGLHRLGTRERQLLAYAALLHHIGGFLTYDNYQAHTYYLIRNADLLGFDQTEIAVIATVALYHRKALPRKKHPEFSLLTKKSQRVVRVLCVLLRLAESLDRSQAGYVRHARLCTVDAQHVMLYVHATHDCQLELWGVQEHLEAFAKVFDRTLEIKMVVQPSD